MEKYFESDDFHGVYLLISQNENTKLKNKIYIGYTVNPNRRIRQHNSGFAAGGAKKTSNRGPWTMVMIIHGFPNNISALRFEWAWQQPKLSRRLKSIHSLDRRKKNESYFEYNFRILCEMLRVGPWNRLPLSIRWISEQYVKDFPLNKLPPMHMTICFGRINMKKKINSTQHINESLNTNDCLLCLKIITDKSEEIKCAKIECQVPTHVYCLAEICLTSDPGNYIPIKGMCPKCGIEFLWHDLILRKCEKTCDLINNNKSFDSNIFNVEDLSFSDNE